MWKNRTKEATYAKLLRACVESRSKKCAQMIVVLLNGKITPELMPWKK